MAHPMAIIDLIGSSIERCIDKGKEFCFSITHAAVPGTTVTMYAPPHLLSFLLHVVHTMAMVL
jgi:hypothetical protein